MHISHIFYLILFILFAAINLASFCLCGWDKRCAKRPHHRRIPEKTLFFWAIIGGSIGLWIGMYFFHHKTKHWYFVWGVPAIFCLQVIAFVSLWWHLIK